MFEKFYKCCILALGAGIVILLFLQLQVWIEIKDDGRKAVERIECELTAAKAELDAAKDDAKNASTAMASVADSLEGIKRSLEGDKSLLSLLIKGSKQSP